MGRYETDEMCRFIDNEVSHVLRDGYDWVVHLIDGTVVRNRGFWVSIATALTAHRKASITDKERLEFVMEKLMDARIASELCSKAKGNWREAIDRHIWGAKNAQEC